jgi:pyruvate dehydrogenase (quinone)
MSIFLVLEKGVHMAKSVGDLLVEVLLEAGVQRMYGVSGDSLNGITDAIRRREQMRWIHVRHEEAAAFLS